MECQAELNAVEDAPNGARLLTIPVHTRPRFRCLVRLPPQGNWPPALFALTAAMPVDGSPWEERVPLPESNGAGPLEVWRLT